MRILHIVTAFPRQPDDVIAPWLVEMLLHLRARGHAVEVFTSAYKGSPGQEFAGIPVHRFRYFLRRWENLTHEETAPDRMKRSVLYRIMPVFFLAAGAVAVWRLCKRERYDLIHVHWPFPLAVWGWFARRACGAHIVTTFYGIELRWVKQSMPLLKRFLAWSAEQSDRVVAISEYTAREIRQLTPVPVEVIPYTVGLERMPERPPRRDENGRPFSVLFVGRLIERKGVSCLIRALGRVDDRRVRALIVGEGPERRRLEELARAEGLAGRVEFWGRVSNERLRDAYAAADAFVLPSVVDSRGDTEGLGVVLLEAMNYRVPVIGSNIGGIPDIVIDGHSGLLVPPNDVGALAEAIRRLVGSPELARALGEAGYRHLRQRFSWETIIDRWERLYDAALAGRPGD
jgi:glycosyltransferase involved in cell wall biosynthesis